MPGIGQVYHSTRARHIDAALGLFYCLDAGQQTNYDSLKQELLNRRPKEAKYGHKDKYPNPPTKCMQPEEFGFD